jgi:hypothetical protein
VYYFFLPIYSPYLIARAALNIGLAIYKTFFLEIPYNNPCHGPAPKATCNPLLSLAQEENRSGDLSRDFLTDRYRPSVKGNSLKPDLYQVRRLYIPSLVLSTRLFFSL